MAWKTPQRTSVHQTTAPSPIRYHPKPSSVCRETSRTSQRIASHATPNETASPTAYGIQSSRRSVSSPYAKSYAIAISRNGTEEKNE